jgi:5'-phosphate synthase pdxT subunit
MILLARELNDAYPEHRLALMDIAVKRNAYGRQLDSFEADIHIKDIGKFTRSSFGLPRSCGWGRASRS